MLESEPNWVGEVVEVRWYGVPKCVRSLNPLQIPDTGIISKTMEITAFTHTTYSTRWYRKRPQRSLRWLYKPMERYKIDLRFHAGITFKVPSINASNLAEYSADTQFSAQLCLDSEWLMPSPMGAGP